MRILLLFFSITFSQVFSTYDYVGSRATAMSGSITSGPGGIWSIFHNPAQLAEVSEFEIVSGHCQIYNLSFLPYSNFGLVYNGWAINFEKLSTKINSINLSSESAFGISKGFTVYKDRQSIIQAGLRFNLYQYDLGDSAGPEGDGTLGINLGQGTLKGLDIGFQGVLNKKYYIAYYLENINSPTVGTDFGSDLPKSFSIGISYMPYEDLLTSFELNQLFSHSESEMRFGIEYYLNESFVIRNGIQINPNRYSTGFSYVMSSIELSYGLITHHVLPITHQISISMKL
tara:strand:+ start:365 stop:1222 length:858 start_codon:yes stop_codon:yes gene_type:complete